MFQPRRPACTLLRVERLEHRAVPAGGLQTFDQTAVGSLPAGWSQWASDATPTFAVSAARALSGAQGLTSTSSLSSRSARAWNDEVLSADAQVSTSLYLDSLIPAGVFARGDHLSSSMPSYYAATIYRGATVELSRTVAGIRTSLLTLKSTGYTSGQWVQLSLEVAGETLRVRVFRTDTRQHLDGTGKWTAMPVPAIELQDAGLRSHGRAGVIRQGAYAGAVTFDDLNVIGTAAPDRTAPVVQIAAPAAAAFVRGTIRVNAVASDNVAVSRVEFLFNGQRRAILTRAPYTWDFNTRAVADGPYSLEVRAFDALGNMGIARQTVTVQNTEPPATRVQVPQHYSHIRVAMLGWSGTPFTDFEKGLLRNSVDLVLPNERYLGLIDQASPDTPQLVYTNLSNLYLDLLTDWLSYADRNGLNRENAFYHVSQATPFTGGSPSSMPVNVFWSVRSESNDLTIAARDANIGDVPFGSPGQSLSFGFPDRFRELNFALNIGAANGWSSVVEYASAVDASGNPTAWTTLPLVSDTTNGFRTSGTLLFDPPADWKPARLGGQTLYYVRVRTLTAGTAPVANYVLGRDYTNATYAANGIATGTITAFDAAADLNHDGYLNDAEYARRAAGKGARFVSESRLFYMNYGQMRFATNPSGAGVSAWAADYDTRFLKTNPLADGLFVDNSTGKLPTIGVNTIESAANYTADYAALLATVRSAVAPRWLMANTAGLYPESDAVIRQVSAHWQEFAMRPLANNWTQFEDLGALVKHRQSLTDPSPYTIIDTLPAGGSATDPRTQIAALAYYYLIGNPETTFFMFNGGNEPATSWTRHWFGAIQYDVGRPQGDWSVFANGTDPANTALGYRVFQRSYTNALVLYKPLSYTRTISTGTLAANTATTHDLTGRYRALQADGTLGAPMTRLTLRNGEGAILVKV